MARPADWSEVKHAAFGVTTLGDITAVAAVAGKSIIVLDLHIHANGTTTVTIKSAAAGSYLFGNGTVGAALAAQGQLNLSSESGALQTPVGLPLLIAHSANVGLSGSLAYVLA